MKQPGKRVLIDSSIEQYDIRLSPGWSDDLFNKVSQASPLFPVAFNIVADLQSICFTASLPRTMATQLRNFCHGFISAGNETKTEKVVTSTVLKIIEKAGPSLDASALSAIQEAGLSIQAELGGIRATASNIPLETIWADSMNSDTFQFGVWGTQHICYVAAFNAYDIFVVACLGIGKRQSTYRRKSEKKFITDLETVFSETLAEHVWGDDEITTARLARHALSHSGGKETNELRQHGHQFELIDKVIQIRARENQALLRSIESRVDSLVDAALQLA